VIRSARQFFDRFIKSDSESGSDSSHQVKVAAAVLLEEMTRADYSQLPEERQAVIELLQETFQLSTDESSELLKLATDKADAAACLHEFTNLINQSFSAEQRILMVELLWRVAYSDSVLDKHEEHLVRKVSDLLHVSHKDFIQAKIRVSDELFVTGKATIAGEK